MKFASILISIVFIIFAVIQLNDPDPWLWVGLYLLVAIVSGMAAFGRYNARVTLAGVGWSLIWMVFLVPEFIAWLQMGSPSIVESMKTEKPYIEFAREFLGLGVALCVLLFYYFRGRKMESGAQ